MIKEWIAEYKPTNETEILAALREIMQEIALAGLSRTDFFEKAAFYGGTSLRIFYGLNRFSEDLDFSLLKEDPDFAIASYFSAMVQEFESLGLHVAIKEKTKVKQSSIDSAFLKAETIWKELVLKDLVNQTGVKSNKSVKIKIEIDVNPPLNFQTEEKLLIRPFSFYVKCFSASSLFAGKLHALLFRKWKNRVKGRDWYDLEWYIQKGISLNTKHFVSRAKDSGDWQRQTMSSDEILSLLRLKIQTVSFKNIKEDVRRFIADDQVLDLWSPSYFNDLIEKITFETSN